MVDFPKGMWGIWFLRMSEFQSLDVSLPVKQLGGQESWGRGFHCLPVCLPLEKNIWFFSPSICGFFLLNSNGSVPAPHASYGKRWTPHFHLLLINTTLTASFPQQHGFRSQSFSAGPLILNYFRPNSRRLLSFRERCHRTENPFLKNFF